MNDSMDTAELEPIIPLQDVASSYEAQKLEEDYDTLLKLVKGLKNPNSWQLDADHVLQIYGSYATDREFVDKARGLIMPPIKQLHVYNLHEFKTTDDIYNVNDFLSNTVVNKMETLVLSGGGIELKDYRKGVVNVLERVTKEAHFRWFQLEDDDIRTISKTLF